MPNFVSFGALIAELALGEKLHTHSLSHSLSLFDAPGTEALLRNIIQTTITVQGKQRTGSANVHTKH